MCPPREAGHEQLPGRSDLLLTSLAEPRRRDLDAALRSMAAEGGVELTVRGGSMEPGLAGGARVRVRRSRRPLPGDVVVVRSGERLLVHRLLGAAPRKGAWRLLTRGDAAPRPDPWVDAGDVIGVVDMACPLLVRLRSLAAFGGFVVRAARRRAGG